MCQLKDQCNMAAEHIQAVFGWRPTQPSRLHNPNRHPDSGRLSTAGTTFLLPISWRMVYQKPRRSSAHAPARCDVADTHLKIAPIGEGLSLKARAYDALKLAILNMNIYADDAQLRLDERDLSQRFGVSRTPLREALAQLDQEGLVRIVARRGIFIVRKTKAEILDMITVWAALESMAARLATQHAEAGEIARLHTLVDQFSQDEVARKMGE